MPKVFRSTLKLVFYRFSSKKMWIFETQTQSSRFLRGPTTFLIEDSGVGTKNKQHPSPRNDRFWSLKQSPSTRMIFSMHRLKPYCLTGKKQIPEYPWPRYATVSQMRLSSRGISSLAHAATLLKKARQEGQKGQQ